MTRLPASGRMPRKAIGSAHDAGPTPCRSPSLVSFGAFWVAIALCLFLASPAKADADDLLEETSQARQAYEAGRWEDARDRYSALAEKAPENTEIRFRLGNVHARLGHLDEAAASYQGLLARQPAYPKGWHNLALIRLQQAMTALGEAERQGSPEAARPSRQLLGALDAALSGSKPAISEQPAAELPAAPLLVAYAVSRVNLRGGCGTGYPKLAMVAVDARMELLARQDACAQVRTLEGQIGWLPLSLLRLAPAAASTHEP